MRCEGELSHLQPHRIVRRRYIPPIGLISMTSIDDCGICKCGWFSNNFVAASCDAASMIEYNIISFLVSEIPLEVTRLVLPPASVLTIIFECARIQLSHSPLIFSSAAFLSFGSVFDHFSTTEAGMRYNTTNFF